MDLYNYIDKYKDITFQEHKMTEVDILIFSQLSYVLLDNIDFTNNKKYRLDEISKLIDREASKKYIYAQRKALDILDTISLTKRFSDIILFEYEYIINKDMQFGALTLKLPTKEVIVSFEGTDYTVSGWKEDAILSYMYPTSSQIKAGEYLNRLISKEKRNIYVCGHSKGANLALVGSMRTNIFKRYRIKEIYSFDGPGLKEKEFNSFNYRTVKHKLKNIIPDQSLIGTLFEQENLIVIKSNKKGIMQHAANSWQVEDDKLQRTKQSKISKELDKTIGEWLSKYNYAEREEIVENLFYLLETSNIKTISDFTDNKIKSLINILKVTKNIDQETKNIVYNCLKLLIGNVSSTIMNDELEKIKNKFKIPKKLITK